MIIVVSSLALGAGCSAPSSAMPTRVSSAAWPAVIPAMILVGSARGHRLALSTLGVTWLLLVLSIPPDGGGLGWGGRLGVVVLGARRSVGCRRSVRRPSRPRPEGRDDGSRGVESRDLDRWCPHTRGLARQVAGWWRPRCRWRSGRVCRYRRDADIDRPPSWSICAGNGRARAASIDAR